MRTYGRVDGKWTKVSTDTAGHDDYVWITTLIQCIKLQPNESPFFAQYGIPVQSSIVTQIQPDFYVSKLQQQFAQYFAVLSIKKRASLDPVYDVNIMTNQGVKVQTAVAV